ncbi:MAG: DUF4129 domain-containing protein [Haloarculaceae archaeon]
MVASVNRKLLALTGLVLLSVVAMSMSAATLTSATGGGDPVLQEQLGDRVRSPDKQGSGVGGSSGEITGTAKPGESKVLRLAGCIQPLASLPGTIAYFGGLIAFIYVLKRRFSLGVVIFAGYAITPVALAFYFLQTKCISAGGRPPGSGGISRALNQTTPGPSGSGPLILAAFAVLFVGVAVAVFFTSGEGEYLDEEEDEEGELDTDVEEIAEAAANAAERLEERNADVDNEVYRAWWEMTQLLDVSSPETHTPGEFADAAVEVGIARRYVDPLTTLFEEVRYGHADPEAREERAIEIFRAIDEEYSADTSEDETTADTDTTEDDQ